jgi:hypothetical protein
MHLITISQEITSEIFLGIPLSLLDDAVMKYISAMDALTIGQKRNIVSSFVLHQRLDRRCFLPAWELARYSW